MFVHTHALSRANYMTRLGLLANHKRAKATQTTTTTTKCYVNWAHANGPAHAHVHAKHNHIECGQRHKINKKLFNSGEQGCHCRRLLLSQQTAHLEKRFPLRAASAIIKWNARVQNANAWCALETNPDGNCDNERNVLWTFKRVNAMV